MRRAVFVVTVGLTWCAPLLVACDDDEGPGPTPLECPAEVSPPVLTDWDCPPGWTVQPGFTDEAAAVDTPPGLTPFTRCAPPAEWSDPSGPVRLRSFECPAGWHAVAHAWLLDEDGAPYSWCEPPKVARLFVPGGNPDGSDYLSPIPDGAVPTDFQQCDPSEGMMPELWGAGCVHIGDPCPEGTFPEIPADVTGNRLYVLADSAGGTGTAASPFGSIKAAIDAAAAGDVIVVGAGTYDQNLTVDKALTLWGACVEQVAIVDAEPTAEGAPATVRVDAPLLVKNIQLTSATGFLVNDTASGVFEAAGVYLHAVSTGVLVHKGGQAHVRDSVIFGASWGLFAGSQEESLSVRLQAARLVVERVSSGVQVFGGSASVEASDVFVRNTVSDGGPAAQPAFLASNSGRFAGTRLVSDQCLGAGVSVHDAEMTLERSFVGNTLAGPSGSWGNAVAILGGRLAMEQVTVRNSVEDGVFLVDEAESDLVEGKSTVILEDVAVIDTKRVANGRGGRALHLDAGVTATLSRTVLSGGAVGVFGSGSVTGSDVACVDMEDADGPAPRGFGLVAETPSQVVLTRALIAKNRSGAVKVEGEQARVELTDAVLRDQLPASLDVAGYGMVVSGGGSARLERAVVADNHVVGVGVDAGALEAVDLLIAGTRPRKSDGALGLGLAVRASGSVSILRGTFADNRWAGIGVEAGASAPTEVTLTDVLVADTTHDDAEQIGGVGLHLAGDQVARLDNVLVRRSTGAGVSATDRAALEANDLVVTDTRASVELAHAGEGGWGVFVAADASLTAERLWVDRSRDSGVVFMDAAPSELSDVVIRDTTFADCAGFAASDPRFCLEAGLSAVSRGLALVGPNDVRLHGFELADNGTMGAQILVGEDGDGTAFTEGGTLTLACGDIAGHQAGVCLQGLPEYDESSLQREVGSNNGAPVIYESHPGPVGRTVMNVGSW